MREQSRILIRKAKGGDISAFQNLILLYDKEVFSIAASHVHTAAAAKSIYQKVYKAAYDHIASLEDESEVSDWISDITENICLGYEEGQERIS